MFETARNSAAFSSGAVSFRKFPPPISGPARYLRRPGLRSGFELDGLEHEVGRVNLAVRVWIADTDDFPLVLEYQHVTHTRLRAELAILRLQCLQETEHFRLGQLGEREVVVRRVANDPRAAARHASPIDDAGRCRDGGCAGTDAGMVVVEHIHAIVLGIALSRATPVAGTEVTVGDVGRQGTRRFRDALPLPGPLVAVR